MATLGSSVGYIKVMESHVLNNFLLLVDVALGNRHILFGLQIILSRVRIRPTDTLDGATCRFNVDDIADRDLLLLNILVDARIQLELLLTLGCLEANDNIINDLAVPSMLIIFLLRGDLRDFAFPDFFGLLDSESNGSSEVFHEDFCLFDLTRVDFRADHRAEGDLRAKLSGDSQSDSSLTCAWRACKEQSFSSHLLILDHINDDSSGLSCLSLAAQTSLNVDRSTCLVKTKSFNVGVRGNSLRASSRSYFFDFHFFDFLWISRKLLTFGALKLYLIDYSNSQKKFSL